MLCQINNHLLVSQPFTMLQNKDLFRFGQFLYTEIGNTHMSHLNIADYLYKAAINFHAENYFMIRNRYTSMRIQKLSKKDQLFDDYLRDIVLDVIWIITVSTILTNGLTSQQIVSSLTWSEISMNLLH